MNSIFKAGGALTDEHAAIYIERQADHLAVEHLCAMDYLLVIEPRQQGKTSLINHLMRYPQLGDVTFAYMDVTTPDRTSEAAWYQSFCQRLLRQLKIIPSNQWPTIPEKSHQWREFLYHIAKLAGEAAKRIVIVLDEIGAATFPGATECFSVLRDAFNSRQAESEFKNLTFMLVGAFHPRALIRDDKISPFNIAHRIRLDDFTLKQVGELTIKGGWSPNRAEALVERIHYWTDGQPYLTQLLCSYMGPDAVPADADAGIDRLRREDENHLTPLLDRLKNDDQLRKYVSRVQAGERIKFFPHENPRQAQLELLGVIKIDKDGCCVIRNRIYELALKEIEKPPSLKLISPPSYEGPRDRDESGDGRYNDLRLDAAVPNQVYLDRAFELAVAVRRLSSSVLTEQDLTTVRSGNVQVTWPEFEPFLRLRVQISAPECEIHGPDNQSFRLYADHDSPIFYFLLTPKRHGEIGIIVKIYQENDWLGSARIHTVVREQVVGSVQLIMTSHTLAEFRYDAFISYSHKDKDWVRGTLLPRLVSEGLRVCIDYRNFEPGLPLPVNMKNAIERSRKILLVLTPDWITSDWTEFEARLIQKKDPVGRAQRIIPLMVKPCLLPEDLPDLTYLDFTNSADFEFQMERLVTALRSTPL